jgi:hypothetical protein
MSASGGRHGTTRWSATTSTPAALARPLVTPLLAVAAVAALLTTLAVLTGIRADDVTTRGARPPSAAAHLAVPSTRTPSGGPATAPAAPTPSESARPSASMSAGEHAALPKVDVLNQNGGRGAARTLADRLEQDGWTIGRVDTFQGNVRTTTVYYAEGDHDAARELAHDLPGQQRLLPRLSTLSESHLSIVLTDDDGSSRD